jgi:hypothetical protein
MTSVHQDIDNPHLRSLLGSVDVVITDARTILDGLSEEQATWRPQAKSWSIVDVINHLLAIGDQYYPRIRETIKYVHEHDMKSTDDYKPGLFAKWFINSMRPDARFKVKTVKMFVPPATQWDITLEPRFTKQQEQLQQLIRSADGYDMNRVKFYSPATRLLRFSIGEGLTLVTVHLQRHLVQAKRLRDTLMGTNA